MVRILGVKQHMGTRRELKRRNGTARRLQAAKTSFLTTPTTWPLPTPSTTQSHLPILPRITLPRSSSDTAIATSSPEPLPIPPPAFSCNELQYPDSRLPQSEQPASGQNISTTSPIYTHTTSSSITALDTVEDPTSRTSSSSSRSSQSSQSRRPRHRTNIVCYRCGQPGHHYRRCRYNENRDDHSEGESYSLGTGDLDDEALNNIGGTIKSESVTQFIVRG